MNESATETENNRWVDDTLGLQVVGSGLKECIQVEARNQGPNVVAGVVNKVRVSIIKIVPKSRSLKILSLKYIIGVIAMHMKQLMPSAFWYM